MSGARPAVVPALLVAATEAVNARARKRLDANPRLAEGWAWSEVPGGLEVRTDTGEVVRLRPQQGRLSTAEDQLRQRVAYALSQIIVISMNKNIYPAEIVPYLQILSRNAFGNYRTLLGEISTSSQMGKYLDIANSNRPANGSAANENYPRELLQLFTIGLWELNTDGSQRLDASERPIPTYDQSTVQQLARTLHILLVGLLSDQANARRGTALDLVQQTRTGAVSKYRVFASAQTEYFLQQLYGFTHRPDTGVRAEVIVLLVNSAAVIHHA
jgi:hypothetical protein